MRILFLTDNFPPESNAPASRTYDHCKVWVAKGHRVTVITCAPNAPMGRLHKGYKNRLVSREEIDDIQVIRVWSYITDNSSSLKRILDYLSYMFMAIVVGVWQKKPDTIIGTSPQFFTVCAAWFLSKRFRCPYVFELRDIWPASIQALGAMKNPVIMKVLEILELFLYRQAHRVISVTHAFKQDLIQRGIKEEKIKVVTNGVDLNLFRPRERDLRLVEGLEGKLVVGYIGNLGIAQHLETLLQCAALTSDPRVQYLIMGEGVRKSALMEMGAHLENVTFLDFVPKSEVPKYWALLDAAIIHLKKDKIFESFIPSKIFECMAMGIPLLHGVPGESADIVVQSQSGLLFEPESPEDLHQKVLQILNRPELRKNLSQAGIQSANNYSRPHLAQQLLVEIEDPGESRRAA